MGRPDTQGEAGRGEDSAHRQARVTGRTGPGKNEKSPFHQNLTHPSLSARNLRRQIKLK